MSQRAILMNFWQVCRLVSVCFIFLNDFALTCGLWLNYAVIAQGGEGDQIASISFWQRAGGEQNASIPYINLLLFL